MPHRLSIAAFAIPLFERSMFADRNFSSATYGGLFDATSGGGSVVIAYE